MVDEAPHPAANPGRPGGGMPQSPQLVTRSLPLTKDRRTSWRSGPGSACSAKSARRTGSSGERMTFQ